MPAFFGADEIWGGRKASDEAEKVILVGVWALSEREYLSEEDFLHSLDELEDLSKACGMDPIFRMTQQLPSVDKALYVRSGKAAEIADLVEGYSASQVIFNDTLSPSQIRNLQKVLKVPVTDRTRLILDIFERRARTRESRLQVELAKLQYLKPRLIGMWETQNRQGGASGSQSSKGEGEKQLEIDRRTIDHRLAELRRELTEVSRERATQRKKRKSSRLPLVALVGYTNAGKSTIMNKMLEAWGAEPGNEDRKVFEADMLFATLDTTVRRIEMERGREFLLSDTVGFIHRLPTTLVEAFKSTLEEVTQADLLLQVVDASDTHADEHIEVTKETLRELGAGHIPMITVYNKVDLCDPPREYPKRGLREVSVDGERNENIYISAKDKESIRLLTTAILEKLEQGDIEKDFLIPYTKGAVQSYLMQNARVENLEYLDTGVAMHVKCNKIVAEKAERMLQ
ncbi:MAG: GTPase HflX [Lachnospiraceae bacterium]|nr:GTPase HflX [Lachnospiraceae bacterium]